MKEATDSRSTRDEMHWKIIQQRGEGGVVGRWREQIPPHRNSGAHARRFLPSNRPAASAARSSPAGGEKKGRKKTVKKEDGGGRREQTQVHVF